MSQALSLDQAARNGMVLSVRCRACAREASFLAADLVAFSHPAKALATIRFRCVGCGARDSEVAACDLDRDRIPDIVVWRPTRLR